MDIFLTLFLLLFILLALTYPGNINDRSLAGNRDSEIGAILTDSVTVKTKMNGKTYYASRSIFEFRCRLFEEHLGLSPSPHPTEEGLMGHKHQLVEDPVCSDFFQGVWRKTSRENTM